MPAPICVGVEDADARLRELGLDGTRLLGLAATAPTTTATGSRTHHPGSPTSSPRSCSSRRSARRSATTRRSGGSGSYTFPSYLWDVMNMRVADFYRRKSEGFGDSRSGSNDRLVLKGEPLDELDGVVEDDDPFEPDIPRALITNGPAPLTRPGPGTGGTSSDATPTVPNVPEPPRLTFREWREAFRMMRDKSYQQTRLGKDVVAYLKWKRLSRAAERTLDQYERDLRLVCLAVGCDAKGVTHADLMLVLEMVPEKSWKRVRAAWRDFFKWAVAEGIRPDNPVDRLPKLRPTADPVYDLWRQDELDLLVAATRRMDIPLIQKLRVLTMIESGCRAAELRGMQAR